MQQIYRAVAIAVNRLPRVHRIMLGSLTAVTLAVTIWRPHHVPVKSDKEAITESIAQEQVPADDILLPEVSEPLDQDTASAEHEVPKDEIDKEVLNENGAHDYVVSSGDTLSSILNQYEIDMSSIAQLVKVDKDLRNMQPGQQLSWTLNDEGQLQQLTWDVSRREARVYTLQGDTYSASTEILQGEWKNTVLKGTVNGSFASSAKEAGLSRNEISAVIKAMQWQMDFRKLRSGDQFSALFSREMLDGKSHQSQLLGVRLQSGGKDYYAIRAEDGKFYDRAGSGLSKGFMRFPMGRAQRVTSGFNPRRVNPVTGRIAPHQGIDFSMPIGTSVLAVGDGEVIVSTRSGAAGNYIALRHGRQYVTRYMHLKTLLVKPGQKVKRGERIALSGNTGRSTGPHLHYEVWINNQAVNPLTAKLPKMEGLAGTERKAYLAQVKEVVPQLQLD
ncbi:MAG: Murein DD-endopeptidase MepM [Candidatus Erwinia impunctatus]